MSVCLTLSLKSSNILKSHLKKCVLKWKRAWHRSNNLKVRAACLSAKMNANGLNRYWMCVKLARSKSSPASRHSKPSFLSNRPALFRTRKKAAIWSGTWSTGMPSECLEWRRRNPSRRVWQGLWVVMKRWKWHRFTHVVYLPCLKRAGMTCCRNRAMWRVIRSRRSWVSRWVAKVAPPRGGNL